MTRLEAVGILIAFGVAGSLLAWLGLSAIYCFGFEITADSRIPEGWVVSEGQVIDRPQPARSEESRRRPRLGTGQSTDGRSAREATNAD